MPKKYRSGFERLSRVWTDIDERYMNAMLAVKENFKGFTKRAGYDPSHPEKLSAAAKKQIRRYYNLLSDYTEGGPTYKLKPSELPKTIKRNKKNIDAVMRSALMHEGKKRSKYIFVPYDGETIPQVIVKNNVPLFYNASKNYAREIIELNHRALSDDVMSTIHDAVNRAPDAKYYRVVGGDAGRFNEFYGAKGSIAVAASANILAHYVANLMTKYNSGNHDWRHWLFGIAAYYTDDIRGTVNDIRDIKTSWQKTDKSIVPGESFDQRIKRLSAEVRRKRK